MIRQFRLRPVQLGQPEVAPSITMEKSSSPNVRNVTGQKANTGTPKAELSAKMLKRVLLLVSVELCVI